MFSVFPKKIPTHSLTQTLHEKTKQLATGMCQQLRRSRRVHSAVPMRVRRAALDAARRSRLRQRRRARARQQGDDRIAGDDHCADVYGFAADVHYARGYCRADSQRVIASNARADAQAWRRRSSTLVFCFLCFFVLLSRRLNH
jgi:hypothetical protein